jgi:acyl-homoserine-lactone acylase
MGRRGAAACAVVLGALCLAQSAQAAPHAVIRWASHGVPHIKATSWKNLGFGYGYALASMDICPVADQYVTVRAQRSRFFGPDATWVFHGNGATQTNLNSDIFFQRINDTQVVEKLLTQAPPQGPRPQVRAIVRGYVAGYNRYLAKTGVDHIPDPACRGAAWVTPISEIDAYRRFYELALLASQAVAIDGIAGAQPLVPAPGTGSETQAQMLAELRERLPLGGVGSNAVALGSAATHNGHGMLLGNPHFPWDGSERFFQSQLTIPGKIDVAGGSLLGVPLVLIGHTAHMAWSHTVSTAFRFTPFELKLVPGSPTTYLYDGRPREMKRDVVTVQVPDGQGGLKPYTRTLYSTVQGPILTSILGLPLFPWTPAQAYAMGDANASNFRYLNHFFDVDRAQSSAAVLRTLEHNQGIPWVNTIAADDRGRALYADISVVPNVPDAKAQRCVNGALGLAATQILPGLPILDGSTSDCAWDVDPDALQPGTFGPSHLPHLFRRDYVTNSNDSYWLSNPEHPLEGFARIIGSERTARSLRTRNGLTMVADRIADGGFTKLSQLEDLVSNDRQYAGVLWRDELAAMCEAHPMIVSPTNGLVDVSEACPILKAWNQSDDLDAAGALLFRRFASHALASPTPGVNTANPFATPFDAGDPVHTPRGLATDSPAVQAALADAVSDLRSAKIPLAAGLRGYQYEKRGDEKIPIHGGPGTLGDFNAINVSWVPGVGYPDVPHGSSFIEAVRFTGNGCPQSRSILTYSQSVSPESPYFGDQTWMFSRKQFNPMRFCERQLARDPQLRIEHVG